MQRLNPYSNNPNPNSPRSSNPYLNKGFILQVRMPKSIIPAAPHFMPTMPQTPSAPLIPQTPTNSIGNYNYNNNHNHNHNYFANLSSPESSPQISAQISAQIQIDVASNINQLNQLYIIHQLNTSLDQISEFINETKTEISNGEEIHNEYSIYSLGYIFSSDDNKTNNQTYILNLKKKLIDMHEYFKSCVRLFATIDITSIINIINDTNNHIQKLNSKIQSVNIDLLNTVINFCELAKLAGLANPEAEASENPNKRQNDDPEIIQTPNKRCKII